MTFEPFPSSSRTAWRSSTWGCWKDRMVGQRSEHKLWDSDRETAVGQLSWLADLRIRDLRDLTLQAMQSFDGGMHGGRPLLLCCFSVA